MSIYLLRHGETDWNAIDRLQGHTDIPLNEKGKKRIASVALVFQNTIGDVDHIISSPLKRARKSAEIFSHCIGYKREIVIEESFIERHFGSAEGLLAEEIKQLYPGFVFPGMEAEKDVYLRAIKALNFYCDTYPGLSILIVTHGAVLKTLFDHQLAHDGTQMTSAPGGLFKANRRNGRYQIEEIQVR